MRSCTLTFAAFLVTTIPANGLAASNAQTITLQQNLQVPGAILKPGNYTFSVEDRLQDRAIVRIASEQSDNNYLLLSVPNTKLEAETDSKLIVFRSEANNSQTLRGWKCPQCSVPLEFVYPKAEAVKVTSESGQSVLAVDPEYDKLPPNLTADDMKIVTLWLLSPKRITAENQGQGVTAAKYDPPVQMASARRQRAGDVARVEHMPKTATNTFALGLWGLLLMAGAAGSWASRRHAAGER